MKIKMKLLLLCAAVAPFLIMNSGQQSGSRFGCVCAMEKSPKSTIESGENCSSTAQVPAELWDMFNKNKEILKQYASENETLDYCYFERIVRFLAKDKGDSIESFKNKLEEKAVDWLDFCFLSAILEGFLASRGQEFEPMESYIRKEFSKDFPFAELKKLTCSMWTQLKANEFRLNCLYRGLIYLMHCRERVCFYLICCLADVQSPYMQLFIACLINLVYFLDADVEWDELINIMNKYPDRLDSDDVFMSILSCFHFESKLNQALMNFYLRVLKQKDGYSAENHDRTLCCLVFLSRALLESDDDALNLISWLAKTYLIMHVHGLRAGRGQR